MTAASWKFIPNTLTDWFVQTVRADNQLQPVVLLSFENQNLNQFLHHQLTVDVSDFLRERPQCSQIFSSIWFLLVNSRIRVLWGFAQLFRNTVFDRSQLGLFLTLQADHRALSGKRCQTAIRKCVWHSVVLQCDSLCTSDFWVFVFPCVQYSRIIICTNVLTVKTAHFV